MIASPMVRVSFWFWVAQRLKYSIFRGPLAIHRQIPPARLSYHQDRIVQPDRTDAAEIESLYRQHGAALLLFAAAITGERSRAQDALHHVFLKLIEDGNLYQLGPDALDWPSAAKHDLESLRGRFSKDPQTSAALTKTISLYVAGLSASKAPTMAELSDLPPQLASLIPNPKRVWEEKQDLSNQLVQARALLP
jgi:hypothetical protein